jgi:SAM-dependent methyltransferase
VTKAAERWRGLRPEERPYRRAAWFYAEHRYRPQEDFFRLLARHLNWTESDRVVDLGAGPAHISLRIAPFVAEVVAVEPESAMLDEGRSRAEDAGATNVSFILGGSDDLQRLSPTLGTFAGVVISQAFHWMRNQDAVLQALDRIVDDKRGAVALIGYVNDPDYNRIWIDREPWAEVGAILREYLAATPVGPNPAGRHDPFPEILARSAFSRVELLTWEHEIQVQPSVEAAIGIHYSLASVLDRLGDKRAAFEREATTALVDADTAPLTLRLTDSALIGRRR